MRGCTDGWIQPRFRPRKDRLDRHSENFGRIAVTPHLEHRTAVLVLGFNRPDETRLVLKAVNEYGPSVLYFAVDGPRSPLEQIQVDLVRSAIDDFTWQCPIVRVFSADNRGSKASMIHALDTAFSDASTCIILEDDCLPSQDFFRFCEAGLSQYEQIMSVGMISGTNFLTKFSNGPYDGLFSDGHIWGWATWKNRWQSERDAKIDNSELRSYYGLGWPYRRRLIAQANAKELDAWDIPWLSSLAARRMWALIPTHNLVTNIGHGVSGTHTTGGSRFANVPLLPLPKEISLPSKVDPNRHYQRRYAALLRFEDLVHRARRPIIALVRTRFPTFLKRA
jgi:hypothetical protein